MKQTGAYWAMQGLRATREQHHGQGRGQGKAGPRRKCAQKAGAYETDRKSHLTAGRTRQKLASATRSE
jgi:hypothetical protein